MIVRSGVVATLLFVLVTGVLSAQPAPSPNLGIDRFGVEDGLPGLAITDIEVAEDGRLWVLASGLLVDFDGELFTDHPIKEGASWRGGRLVGIGAGRGDTLWVTVGPRLYAYVGGRMVERARHDDVIRDVRQAPDGRIWAWDWTSALLLGPDGFKRVGAAPPGRRLPLVTEETWLDLRGGSPRMTDVGPGGSAMPTGWAEPADGVLLVRPRGEFFDIFDAAGTALTSIPGGQPRRLLVRDRRGLIWTASAGAAEAWAADGSLVASLPLAPGSGYPAVRGDREGNLWLGSARDGLFRIRPLPVRTLGAAAGLTDGPVIHVANGGGGSVLVTSEAGRAVRVSPFAVDTLFDPTPGTGRAVSGLVDRRGTVWIATISDDGGLLRGMTVDGREISARLPLSSNARLLVDPVDDGLLWILGGNVTGVRPYAPGGADSFVLGPEGGWGARAFVTDGRGSSYVGGPRGLVGITPEGREEYLATEGFPTGNTRALLLDADGTLWIGRYGGGLVRFREGEFRSVRSSDGLWDDVVASLVEDDDGDFWMASNRGVHRVHRSEVEDFLEGRIDAVGGRGYGGRDGFVNPETTGDASYRSEDGRLWFPTFAGVAVVDPEELDALEETPPGVRIRGAWLDETLRPVDSALHLPLGRRRIEIEYGGILLRGGERMRYEVRVEDVDPDWVDVGPLRRVTYGNLPPGRHTFRVRAVAPSGTVRSEPATATLVIPPYVWETPAFRGLMVLLGAVALVGVGQLRSRRLRARAAELSSLIDARTAELAEAKARTEMALVTVENQAETLRSLDAAKSRFFANVSHELRTPLTLLRGPLRDVLEGRHGELPKAVEEQVSIALDSGYRLTELVEQLLDVARLEAGKQDLTLAIHDLGALLRRLVGSFGALATSRGINFRAEVPDGPIRAFADLDRMEKVYSNLLANALKFTPSGGTVGIEAALDGQEVVVSVQDTGPGIAPADQERIFERFQQVDDSDRRAHEGAGLGLTLVREITELHGGTVELTSTPGEGSRFTVRIPTGRPDEGAGNGTGDAVALDPSVEDLETDLDLPDGTDRDGAEDGEAEPPTVLVIEDHDELRAYVRRHLEPDYRVLEASDGRQGLAAARQTVPDVILCDIMMPKTDGEAVVRAIRADPELDHLPVVMLTAKASRESRLSALEGGANDYLVKPFDPEELRLRVHNMLESRRRLADRIREESRGLPLIAAELEAADPADRFVRRFRTVLGERLGDEEFDTEAMAAALSMSRASLYRKCGDAFDVSPAELIWRARLDRAAQLLRTTDGTVSVVAYACGFKTVPHFTRRFRERFGDSPAAWRASE